ncbi:leucine-rich repeat protein [Flavobacteriaceae bacterium S0825]|uniref:leucine-rich repeat protein n=1 Tax=Gaetbulibacter sp. S0825 TaxID=2720084 RepID=UPI00143229B6|nr:leucine-rich repeat protein [Gaetbulibacter sp. S0825]MCK0109910.1 leucine-rich repeat protein [Flavobacteriaceae bacterium S0825]NIX65539.1 leucine-rich repeat protein [Gaetbulibacter sp. S0825]
MSKFRFFDSINDGKFLKIETDRLSETIKYINKEKISNLYISRHHGYNLNTIEPLLDLKGIKKLQYQEHDRLISMEGIENFSELEYLRIDDEQKIDLSAFPHLRFLIIKWSKKILNFEKCDNLKHLNLWNFNTKEKDFSNFPHLKGLEVLNLFWGNAQNLNKLQLSDKIKKIEFHRYPKLESISNLKNHKTIEYLYFENCKRITDIESITGLPNLKTFCFNECGELNNIDFISKMDKLVDFRFVRTNVKNGDLKLLENDKFKYIGFDNKKHYSHKYESLKPIKE